MTRGGPQVAGRSKKERIYRTLRQEVLSLTLPPGAILVEGALSRRFRAGRSTIREALALLQQDGLVTAMPRRGYLVASITVDDVQELFELRLILEPAIARLAATRITPAELDRLAALADPPHVVVERRKIRRFVDRNREFHLGLARATRNDRLVRLIDRTLDEMTRLVAVAYETGEHVRVVEALRSGNEDRAAAAMSEHVLMTRERVFKRELGRPPEGHRPALPALLAPDPKPATPRTLAGPGGLR